MLVTSASFRLTALGELVDTGSALDAALVGLYKVDHEPSVEDNFAYYTDSANEANFTGYTRGGAITWSAVFQDSNKNAFVLGGLVDFAAAAPTPPAEFVANVVYGFFVYKGTTLLYAERFKDANGVDTPVTVANQYGVVPVIPRFSYGQ